MLERVSDNFSRSAASRLRRWRWVRSDFLREFHDLLAANAFALNSGNEIIWRTRSKYVLKIRTSAGRTVVFKHYCRLKIAPYLHHGGSAVREAENFHNFSELGIPMATLLAVGGSGGFAAPRTGFVVTEFVENSRDGRAFYPNGELAGESALRGEFLRRNLGLLAKIHDAGFHHRGFTPANELWRELPRPDEVGNRLELFWVDVASCRREKEAALRKGVPDDIAKFLKPFAPPPEERRQLLQVYSGEVKIRRQTESALSSEVQRRLGSAE